MQRRDEGAGVQLQPTPGVPVTRHAEGQKPRGRLGDEQPEGSIQRLEAPTFTEVAHHPCAGALFGVCRQQVQPGEVLGGRLWSEERDT